MSKNSLEEMASHYRHSRVQTSSFPNHQLNPEPQFSASDIEKLESLKRYNLSQIKNLFPPGKPQPDTNRSRSSILEDEAQSLQSESGSRYSSNRGSQAHFAQPNSYQSFSNPKHFAPSLGPILSRNPIDDEPSIKRTGLMSFKGSPREANSNSTLRTLSKTVGVDKYPQETYFEHSDFDLYVDAMSKRICEADIKSKFNELKHSANLLKLIAEAGPEDDIDQIFNKHMTPDLASVLDSSKPLYKMVAEAGMDHSVLRNMREDYQQQLLISGRHSLQESSRANTQRGDVNSMVLNSAKRKVDSQGKLSDKHESFEAFLMDQGIGAPVYANANANTGKTPIREAVKEKGHHEVHSHGNLLLPQQQDHNNSFSFIKQMDDNNVSMMQSQAGGVSADLHMFLMQNLREIMEVKDILRDGIAYGIMESRENLKTSREERRDNDPSALFTQNNGDEDQLEQKLHEGQMERLVNKVQALNEKLKKYEQESLDSKRMNQAMKKCLRIGKVRLSELISAEVDIASLSLDYLAKDYPLQARYLYVYTTHLAFCNDASETEKEQRFHLSEIEQIYYLEKPGSTFFMMKLWEKDEKNDKSWTQESLKLSSQVRAKTIETLSHFYFIEIEDQAEMSAWELAFFVANFKIIAGNLSFSVNKIDFLNVVRSFVQKYLVTTGETSRSLVDLALKPQIQVNGSPQLSRMASTNSEQGGNEKLGIMDIWNRKKLNLNGNNIQLPAFVKKRSDESEKIEKIEVKEESISAGNVPKKIVYQKQRSLPIRGASAEDDLSSVEEGGSGEGNLEYSPDVQEEKKISNFIKTLSKGSTLELDDEVFSKNLAILLDGVVLSKYGKWGKSHDRHVKMSNDLTHIQWVHPLKGSKRRSGIEVNTIYSVLSGKKSMYFAKKKMLPPELELCFSIVAKSRSLHLQAPNLQTRDYFVEALEYIIKDKNKLKKVAEQADAKMRK